jgi:hypothetical protein
MWKPIEWSLEKNKLLQESRWICFEDILNSEILDDLEHPNKIKFPNQRMFIVNVRNYIYVVPYIENEKHIFLKTIYPDRRYNKIYKN